MMHPTIEAARKRARAKEARTYTARILRRARGRVSPGDAARLGDLLAEYAGRLGRVDWVRMRTPQWLARDWAELPRSRARRMAAARSGFPFDGYGPGERGSALGG